MKTTIIGLMMITLMGLSFTASAKGTRKAKDCSAMSGEERESCLKSKSSTNKKKMAKKRKHKKAKKVMKKEAKG